MEKNYCSFTVRGLNQAFSLKQKINKRKKSTDWLLCIVTTLNKLCSVSLHNPWFELQIIFLGYQGTHSPFPLSLRTNYFSSSCFQPTVSVMCLSHDLFKMWKYTQFLSRNPYRKYTGRTLIHKQCLLGRLALHICSDEFDRWT